MYAPVADTTAFPSVMAPMVPMPPVVSAVAVPTVPVPTVVPMVIASPVVPVAPLPRVRLHDVASRRPRSADLQPGIDGCGMRRRSHGCSRDQSARHHGHTQRESHHSCPHVLISFCSACGGERRVVWMVPGSCSAATAIQLARIGSTLDEYFHAGRARIFLEGIEAPCAT